MGEAPDLATALAEAARTLHGPTTLEETLDTIAQTAQFSVPGFDHVGISISHGDGRIETMSGTSPLVWRLDELQYSCKEGPCVDSVREAPVVVVEHARHDQRWPHYMPGAAREGLRSQLALRLYTDRETLGCLNLYSTASDSIDPGAVHVAELFAAHASIALGRARQEDQLNQALISRKTIGEAVGIIMERYQIDEHRAFQFLARASQNSNTKLRAVAQEIIDETTRSMSARRERPDLRVVRLDAEDESVPHQ